MSTDSGRADFKFRFLSLQKPFWDYVSQNEITPSKAIRHFIKAGITNSQGFNINEQRAIKDEIIQLKRIHGQIGNNLNQIARYFNQNGYLIESELHQNHLQLLQQQKQISRQLNDLLMHL